MLTQTLLMLIQNISPPETGALQLGPSNKLWRRLRACGLCAVLLLGLLSCLHRRQEEPSAVEARHSQMVVRSRGVPQAGQHKYTLLETKPNVRLILSNPPSLGDNIEQCRTKIGLQEVPADEALASSPLDFRLNFLQPKLTVMWIFNEASTSSRVYLFGVFSEGEKRHLVDLIEFNSGVKVPRVKGVYHKALAQIHSGMTIQQLFDSCGSEICSYFQDNSQKWQVRFTYIGYGQSQFVFEADAATGTIYRAYDGGI